MGNYWANLDLHLDVDLRGSRPGRSLEAALRAAARDGRLAPGTRLPASRALAADLGLARNTVAEVYAQLTAEGWLTARAGAGTWIAERPAAASGAERDGAGEARRGKNSGDGPAAARRDPAGPPSRPRYSLHPGVPDLASFPRREWLAEGRRALNAAPVSCLEYPDPRGVPALREALAAYLARVRGVRISPERIVVCAGFTHGLALLCRALRGRGATAVAVEAFGLPEHQRVITGSGLRLSPLPVDINGAMPNGSLLAPAAAALLTPAHQFPLGAVLSPDRRRSFAEWAADTGALLIEDDYDGEFRYDRHPVGALHALAPRNVVYGGTASKALAPGLRLGWLGVPSRFLDDVVTAARMARGGPDVIGQLTLAGFLASGAYDRQVRQMRLAYRRRRDELAAVLRREAPGARVSGIAAGLHALVELPSGLAEETAIARALRHGAEVQGLAPCAADPGREHPPALTVGYGCPPPGAFPAALAALCAALRHGA